MGCWGGWGGGSLQGVAAGLQADSLSSGSEDDGQRMLCKPSGFQSHSRVFSTLMHDSFVRVPLTRLLMRALHAHAGANAQLKAVLCTAESFTP